MRLPKLRRNHKTRKVDPDWKLLGSFISSLADDEYCIGVPVEQEIDMIRYDIGYYITPDDQHEEWLFNQDIEWQPSLWFKLQHLVRTKTARYAPDWLIWQIIKYNFVVNIVKVVICTFYDHNFVDDSYGTPNTGYMGVHCVRCGWSTGSKLY